MSLLSVLMFPAMVVRYSMGWYGDDADRRAAVLRGDGVGRATSTSCRSASCTPDWRQRLKYLPFLMSIGIGLCVNNTRAVLEALFGKESEFARTPKYGIERDSDEWAGKKYHQSVGIQPIIEVALGLYFTATVFYALSNQIYGTLPFLMLFQVGFLYTGLLSILQQFTGEDIVLRRRKSRSRLQAPGFTEDHRGSRSACEPGARSLRARSLEPGICRATEAACDKIPP